MDITVSDSGMDDTLVTVGDQCIQSFGFDIGITVNNTYFSYFIQMSDIEYLLESMEFIGRLVIMYFSIEYIP